MMMMMMMMTMMIEKNRLKKITNLVCDVEASPVSREQSSLVDMLLLEANM